MRDKPSNLRRACMSAHLTDKITFYRQSSEKEGKNPMLHRQQAHYALIQGLYWAVYCLMVGFASAYMLDVGFTNAQIGLVLGSSYLFSMVLQMVIGAWFSRHIRRLNQAVACKYIPVVVLSLGVMLLPLGKGPLAAALAAMFTIQSMMQPSVNALHQSFEQEGQPVNFGLARGVGSAAYALSSFAMGRVLVRFSPGILPAVYGVVTLALILALLTARTRPLIKAGTREDERGASYAGILKKQPTLILFLLGAGCMFLTYSFIDNFLLQILISIGGNSASLGTAITLSAMTELPAMLLFAHFGAKGRGLRIYLASIWFWLLKDILTFFAGSTGMLYAVQLLNFFSCAIYVPGMMYYMRRMLPLVHLLRGVTLAGTVTTLGSLIATVLGGWLIDAAGVRTALGLVQIFAVSGTVMMTIALVYADRYRPSDQ